MLVSFGLLCALAVVSAPPLVASDWEACAAIEHEYRDRFGRAPSARTDAELRSLLENPTFLHAGASHASDDTGATVDIMTETHAVYPVRAADLNLTFGENEDLPSYMPNLSRHEVICHPTRGVSRQRQTTDFGVLVFSLGSDYIIDVEYVHTGPQAYSSRWALVESLDGRLAYLYGSWYFESVRIDGMEATYVHHFARTGLTTSVPGVRAFAGRRADDGIIDVFDAVFEETARRFGRTDGRLGRRRSH